MTIKNSAAKEEILKRISSAQKQAGLPDHVEVPREYQREGTLSDDELRDMLVDRLEDYKADVHVTDEAGLNSTIVDILKDRGCSTVTYAPGIDTGLLNGFEGTTNPDDNAKDPRELNDVDAVLTESHVPQHRPAPSSWSPTSSVAAVP